MDTKRGRCSSKIYFQEKGGIEEYPKRDEATINHLRDSATKESLNEYNGDDFKRLCNEEKTISTTCNRESCEKFGRVEQIGSRGDYKIYEWPLRHESINRRCASDYRTPTTTFLPTPSERKLFNSGNSRNYIERWRGEWGHRPAGFREGRDFHYWWWRRTYIRYLRIIYDRLLKNINSYKKGSIRKIKFEEFIDFAYIHSSGYIINYT